MSQPEGEYELRLAKLEEFRKKGITPYPNGITVSHTSRELLSSYDALPKEEVEKIGETFRISGRVMLMRSFGKAAFAKLKDRHGTFQVFLEQKTLSPEDFELSQKIDLGDFLYAEGKLFRTKTNELTLRAEKIRLAAKSLRPLPEKWHGLTDVETRYRQRYLDLISNDDVKEVFFKRSKIVQAIREYFSKNDFVEVETPMMHGMAGGAAAKPFVTHHNALDHDFFLRIAPELHLKRLVVGGFERVFEINRNFRNEGVSTQHNPEFTMLEFYQAYAVEEDLMKITEDLFGQLALALHGKKTFTYQGKEISFEGPFRRISYPEMIREGESNLVQPTFVTPFPLSESPLARKNDNNPEVVDRFELYVAGMEIANGFSELNDPLDQKERFLQQVEARKKGDEEAMPYDEDYIRALEYGLPPTAGEGIGIDRLVMLLTDQPSIRDVILFPLMRPEK